MTEKPQSHDAPEADAPALVELAPGIHMLPVVHHSVAFANEARRVLEHYKFDHVAIEMPQPLAHHIAKAVGELPRLSYVAWRHPETGEALGMAIDPCDARVEAYRVAMEKSVPVSFVDTIDAGADEAYPILPDHAVVERIGARELAERWEVVQSEATPTPRQRTIAARLQKLFQRRGVLFVASITHLPAMRQLFADQDALAETDAEPQPAIAAQTMEVKDELLGLLLGEMPAVTWLYEEFRQVAQDGEAFPYAEAVSEILRDAAEEYSDEVDEEINLTEWRAIYQYARNLALVRNKLHPGLEELVTAACGCVDDDYGARVLEVATTYAEMIDEEDFDIETEADDLIPDYLREAMADEDDDHDHSMDDDYEAFDEFEQGKRRSRDIYFDFGEGTQKTRNAYPRPALREIEFRFKRRPSIIERMMWQDEFIDNGGNAICSWPPEDERIEKFFAHLRQRAMAAVSSDLSRSEEFQSSMLDGLDFRETTRNFHTGKLYVRRERKPPGKVGPVVLCWHDYTLDTEGLWRTTLHAEHQNESDICVYCAPLGREMIGPMISRTEYHGILSIYPARRIPDLWTLPALYRFETCARLLLGSAILLSEEKYVAWVAPVPPDPDMVQFGRDHGVGVIHLPLSSFSRKTLKRVRKVHILGSYAARGWGADYIED